MRVGTLRTESGTVAVRVDGDDVTEIEGVRDVGELLATPDWRTIGKAANGGRRSLADIELISWAPVVPHPSKVVCVGLNYRTHILEMGRELPEFPTLFAKYPEALIGAGDPIVLPREAADAVDWEAELAVIIGKPARRVSEEEAGEFIAGYSVLNDVTMRDYQYRTVEWFQGKTFEKTTPVGPWLVTPDEFTPGPEMSDEVDGEIMQRTRTDDLVFGPEALVSYISTIFTLTPGDIIATGTPGGVGHARDPKRYLADGNLLVTSIAGLGELRNPIVRER
jgi:acylpyruvate hydrolase